MTKSNRFDRLIVALFAMCMAVALAAAVVIYLLRAFAADDLHKGIWLLITAVCLFGVKPLMRLERRLCLKWRDRRKAALEPLLLTVVFGAGLCLRLMSIAAIPLEPASDFATYYSLGEYLLNGPIGYSGYLAQFPHALGYPMLLLAPLFSLFGVSVRGALLANVALGMGSVVLVWGLARRLWGRFAGLAAMALMSLWPSHILFSTFVAAEPLFTFLILLATVLAVAGMMRDERSLFAGAPLAAISSISAAGAVLGLAGMVRPMAVLLVIAMGVAMLQVKHKAKTHKGFARQGILGRGWMCALVMALSYLASSGLLAYKPASPTDAKPVSGLWASGYSLMVGMNFESLGTWNEADAVFFGEQFILADSADAAHQKAMAVGFKRITDNPAKAMGLMAWKYVTLWGADDFAADWNLAAADEQGVLTEEMAQILKAIRLLGSALYIGVLLLVFRGALDSLKSKRKPPMMFYIGALFFLGTALLHMLLETQVRYHYSILPYLILLAAMTLHTKRRAQKDSEDEGII